MNSEAYVHLGQWINWADGSVKGPRITLTESGGAYLIAFLALFVRMAGQHSWGILSYLLFRARQRRFDVDDNPLKDPFQSILRNVHVDATAAWDFICQLRRPQTSRSGLMRRCVLFTFVAISHALLFLAAGIFVSKVANTGQNQVLLRGHACGIWQNPASFGLYGSGSLADTLENEAWSAWNFGSSAKAGDFSSQCYNTTAANSALANCNAYAPNLLEWEVETTPSCPFEEKMCQNGTTVRLDSGYLDSLHHFGINSPAGDRIKYRRVVECSPLTREGYVSDRLTASQLDLGNDTLSTLSMPIESDSQFQRYNYGPNQVYDMNSTFIWDSSTLSGPSFGIMATPNMAVDVELYNSEYPDSSTFIPIEEMRVPNADTIIYFLEAILLFMEPVHDPWFQATTPVPVQWQLFTGSETEYETRDLYNTDNPAGVMGCTQQFQYCNHDKSKCSVLAGMAYGGSLPDSITAWAKGLDLNTKQQSTLNRLQQASYNQGLYSIAIQPLGLLAQRSISSNMPPALPDNQWMLEMQHYFLTGLTAMQMQLTSFASGPPDPDYFKYLTPPHPDEEWMCSSQIVQRSGYATFSILGIGLVVGFGALVIIINLVLPTAGKKISARRRRGNFDASGEKGIGSYTDRWEDYYHLTACSSRNGSLASTLHFVEPADSWSKKASSLPQQPPSQSVVKLAAPPTADDSTEHLTDISLDYHTSSDTNTTIYKNNFTRNLDPRHTHDADEIKYKNDFTRNIGSEPMNERPSRRERLRQVFGGTKKHDEDSEFGSVVNNQEQGRIQ